MTTITVHATLIAVVMVVERFWERHPVVTSSALVSALNVGASAVSKLDTIVLRGIRSAAAKTLFRDFSPSSLFVCFLSVFFVLLFYFVCLYVGLFCFVLSVFLFVLFAKYF